MCENFVLKIGQVGQYAQSPLGGGTQAPGFRAPDGTIYLSGGYMSTDGGRTIVSHGRHELDEISVLRSAAGAVMFRPGLFLALDEYADFYQPGVYLVKAWRSVEPDLRDIKLERAVVNVPDGPKRPRKDESEWWGLYFYRSILELQDGTLIATMEGHLDSDRVLAHGRNDKIQLGNNPRQRTIIVCSEDQGRNWKYLSTVVYPQEDDDAGGEGFGEPSMLRLDDGRLLCVMRSGDFTPLYQSWSTDDGKSWSRVVYTGLERGVDPCLLKLADGRLLLAYGHRFPAGWPGGPGPGENAYGKSLIEIAISDDGTGEAWRGPVTIGAGVPGTYPTIFEVEPNLVFCHAGPCFWRIMLMPRIPDTL